MEIANLKLEIRNYAVFKIEILTPNNYIEIYEGYNDIDSRED
jgi:hypothetical protein